MQCPNPIRLKRDSGEIAYVPCGTCKICLSNKRAEWAFRCQQENKVSDYSVFLTLTYDEDHLIYGEVAPTLRKCDLQLYFKRLRKVLSPFVSFKYYAVGEYGSETYRPHYHALLFFKFNRTVCNVAKIEQELSKRWTKGFVYCGQIELASITYVLKYVMKQSPQLIGCEPTFSLISNGLGIDYVHKAKQYHLETMYHFDREFVTLEGGAKCTMPRYYRDKIFAIPGQKRLPMAYKENKAKYMKRKQIEAEKKREQSYFKKHPNKSFSNYYKKRVEMIDKRLNQKQTKETL